MPGATLPNMLITLPTLGGDEGIWDDELNAALSLIDVHDHTTNKGARIPTAGLNINANLSMGGFALTSTGSVDFQAVAALVSGSKRLFVSSVDNELYWRTNAGTNVKLTSGTSINTSLVGGIVGDYAAVGAEVAYDDANDRYTFKQQGSKPWARMASGPVRIFEFNTTETLYVELIAPSTLAASYTITLPTAAPGSAAFLQMSSSGVISASNTMANPVTATDFLYTSDQTILVPACAGIQDNGGTAIFTADRWQLGTSTGVIAIPLALRIGDRIKEGQLYIRKTSASGNIRGGLQRVDMTTGTGTNLGESGNAANNPGYVQAGVTGLTHTVLAHNQYYAYVIPSGTTGDFVLGARVIVDRPV